MISEHKTPAAAEFHDHMAHVVLKARGEGAAEDAMAK